MNAKKHRTADSLEPLAPFEPRATPRQSAPDQTRKVEGMSELVAEMLLDDPDATLPPPEASPGSFSAVRSTGPRPTSVRPSYVSSIDPDAPRGSRIGRAIVIAVLLGLGVAAAVVAAMFLTT